MLIELIAYTSAELNTAIPVTKSITDLTISGSPVSSSETVVRKHLTTNTITVSNESGATIHFVPLTKLESNIYTNDTSITEFIPVSNNTEKSLNDLRGEIDSIVCSGTAGHSSGLTFVCYKD